MTTRVKDEIDLDPTGLEVLPEHHQTEVPSDNDLQMLHPTSKLEGILVTMAGA